jgi:hypothetical protein
MTTTFVLTTLAFLLVVSVIDDVTPKDEIFLIGG